MPSFHFDPNAYGPQVAALLTLERLPELGPGSPNLTAKAALQSLENLATTRFTANGADLSRQTGPANGPTRKRPAHTGVLYFVPKAEGYDLVEREGELPSVGEALDFGEQQYVVTKVGRSPLPFDRRSCVFLTAV